MSMKTSKEVLEEWVSIRTRIVQKVAEERVYEILRLKFELEKRRKEKERFRQIK